MTITDVEKHYLTCLLVVSSTKGSVCRSKILLDHGVNINATDEDGDTALHMAALYGHLSLAQFLIESGANIEAENSEGETPVYNAFMANNHGMVYYLLSKGACLGECLQFIDDLDEKDEYFFYDSFRMAGSGDFSRPIKSCLPGIVDSEGFRFILEPDFPSYLSEETLVFLTDHSVCSYCGRGMNEDLSLCPCSFKHSEDKPLAWSYKMSCKELEKLEEYLRKDKLKERSKRSSAIRKKRFLEVVGHHSAKDIKVIWKLQEGECYFCGELIGESLAERKHHKDHLEPISKGGTDWPINIALTCKQCNQSKHSLTESKFWLKLKKIYGKEWVLKRKETVKGHQSQKRTMTKQYTTQPIKKHGD